MSSSESSDDPHPSAGAIASVTEASPALEPKTFPRITSAAELHKTLDAVTEGERDHQKLIAKVNERLQKVGLTMPGVEVRWNDLLVELEPPRRPITQALRGAAAAFTARLSPAGQSAAASNPTHPARPTPTPSAPSAPSTGGSSSSPPCKAAGGSSTKRPVILDAGSGSLLPGRMCLMLGPPGAGRTTLLKALAGQLVPPAQRRDRHSAFLTAFAPSNPASGHFMQQQQGPQHAGRLLLHGAVSYNGLPADGSAFEVARAAAYVGQTEVHLPELTVRETLTFAAECQGQESQRRLHEAITQREAAAGLSPDDPDLELLMALARVKGPLPSQGVVELVARMLGIDHVMDTVVGNEMLKGISGGQKRRVTAGEMAVGMNQVMMLDEVTNGLDAASALAIVRSLRNACEFGNVTLLATLLQPSPDVVDCFHDVMMLAGGRLVYHGPLEGVLPYFAAMGLAPLPGQSLADFVQEVLASPQDQARYRVMPPPAPQGQPPPPPPLWSGHKWVSPKRMRRLFEVSEAGRAAEDRLAQPPFRHPLQDMVLHKERYGTSTAHMWLTVLRREAVLAVRNKPFFVAGLFQVLLTGFLVSTAFVRLDHVTTNDANLFMSVMFFSLMTLFMTGFNFGPIYCNRLAVYYKQRDHRFYSPLSYAIATVAMRMPEVVVQAVSYSVMVYFSVGFTMEAGRFFLFMLNMLLAGFNSVTSFTLMAAVMRNESATQGLGAVFLMVSTLMSGFPIAPGYIPGWWIWVYWIAPMAWSFRSLVVTEMSSGAWAPLDPNNPGGPTAGLEALRMRGIPTDWKWVWAGLGAVTGVSLLQVGLQAVALAYLGPLRSSRAAPDNEPDDDQPPNHQLGTSSCSLDRTAAAAVGPRRSSEAWSAPSPAPTAAALAANVVAGGDSGGTNGSVCARPATPPRTAGVELTAAAAGANGGGSGAVAVTVTVNGGAGAAAAATTAAAAPNGGGVLAFRPVVMAFLDVSYFVRPSGDKDELQLLDKVSGVFRPGVLTSLMGASGAGKTTLMDVLAGRKTSGRVEGLQLVNGAPKRQSAFTRCTGYVEQLDVHSPYTTVEEAMMFSAQLRVSSDLLPASRALAFVRQMMQVVELGPLAQRLIGLGGPAGGLSTEARKRLTIAVELVANPSIVFMDEPTTGLDARAAALVMRAVRNTVATGRTVVCTIHQPNREIMDSFDELLLLKPGGRTIFFGPLGERQTDLVRYLSALLPGGGGEGGGGGQPYQPHMNPAEWMLEVTSPAAEAELGTDFADVWAASELAKAANKLIAGHCGASYHTAAIVASDSATSAGGRGGSHSKIFTTAPAAPAGADVEAASAAAPPAGEEAAETDEGSRAARPYAQPTAVQLWLLLRRSLLSHWRNGAYNGVRFVIAFALAWILGSLYWGAGRERNSMIGLMNIMGVIFCAALFLPMTNLMMVMPQVMAERSVFYREKASGMYHPAVFAAVQGLAEMPYVFVESVLYVIIMYCTIQFEFDSEKALWFWLFIWLALVICTFMGSGFMNLAPNMPAAIAACSGLVLLWNLFCGFLIARPNIRPWYLWAYYGNPITYIIYGCVTTQLGDVWDEQVALAPGFGVPVAQFVKDSFGYNYEWRGWIVLILIGFVMLFRGTAYLGICQFNFQNR